MKTIRRKVFETNSSSAHTISLSFTDEIDTLGDPGDIIEIQLQEFGWGYDEYDDAYNKLSYVLTELYANYNEDLEDSEEYEEICKMVKDYCGVIISINESSKDGCYIDHQSRGMLRHWMCDSEHTSTDFLKEFIFNKKYILVIDNDNH